MFYKNLLFFGLIFVSACGFSPLNTTQDVGITQQTQQIAVHPIPNAEGWQLKRLLTDKLNPTHDNAPKRYTLDISLNAPTFTDQSIQGDNFASRETIYISATYTLKDTQTNQVLLTQATGARGAYNIVLEPYATQVARNRVKTDLINIISDNISLRIKAYFKAQEDNRESQTVSN